MLKKRLYESRLFLENYYPTDSTIRRASKNALFQGGIGHFKKSSYLIFGFLRKELNMTTI